MKGNNQDKAASNDLINTVVGRGTHIKGSINMKNSCRIDGCVKGNVSSDQDVFVGEGGVIEGKINSHNAIIAGKVLGTVSASVRVVLEDKAELKGDIHSEQLRISDGARFNGYCYMLKNGEKRKQTQ